MDSDSRTGTGEGDQTQAQQQEQLREVPPQVLLVLLAGYAAALAIMVNALAVAARHRWWFGAAASLALLARVIPDVLELAGWLDRPQPWPLPFDPQPWLAKVARIVAQRDWTPPSQTRDEWLSWFCGLLQPRLPRSRLLTVLIGLCLATMIAGWAAWSPT
jgi:hypothetical protein